MTELVQPHDSKSSHSSFTLKISTDILTIFIRFFYQDVSKIAQFGHTGSRLQFEKGNLLLLPGPLSNFIFCANNVFDETRRLVYLGARTNGYLYLQFEHLTCIFINGPTPGLFFIYFRLFKYTLQILQEIKCEKMSIRYMVLGLELTTFGI